MVPGQLAKKYRDQSGRAPWDIKAKGAVFVDAPLAPAGNGLRFLRFGIANGQ